MNEKRQRQWQRLRGVIVLAVCGLCLSCTLIHHYKPPDDPPKTSYLPGAITYEIHDRSRSTSLGGFKRYSLFIDAVKQALLDSGYRDPVYLPENDGANNDTTQLKLIVDVEVLSIFYDYGHAAAPQEWLTGLSLGVIPSWATRHELKLTFDLFDDGASVRHWEYMTKSLWINHLLVFPIAIFQMTTSDDERKGTQLAVATKHFMGTSNK